MAESKHPEVSDQASTDLVPDPSMDHKIIQQHVGPQDPFKEQIQQANQAQVANMLYPIYLTGIFDRLLAVLNSRLNQKDIGQDLYELYLKKWNALEEKHGRLGQGGYYKQLKLEEWRQRFLALNELIDTIGMGFTRADQRKNLGPPLPMSAYHKCPENCPMLQKFREDHRRFE